MDSNPVQTFPFPKLTASRHGSSYTGQAMKPPHKHLGFLWARMESNHVPLTYQVSVLPVNYVPKIVTGLLWPLSYRPKNTTIIYKNPGKNQGILFLL